MTGTTPIPFTGIAEDGLHAQRFFNINLNFMPCRFHILTYIIHIFYEQAQKYDRMESTVEFNYEVF
jgi:hypothetical protein